MEGFLSRWFSLKGGQARKSGSQARDRRFRPGLEVLEGRQALTGGILAYGPLPAILDVYEHGMGNEVALHGGPLAGGMEGLAVGADGLGVISLGPREGSGEEIPTLHGGRLAGGMEGLAVRTDGLDVLSHGVGRGGEEIPT